MTIIPEMDASHCQIKKFSLNANEDTKCLPILSEPQQSKTIEYLSSYNLLKSFSSLTTLCICFAGINEEMEKDKEEQVEQNTINLNALFRSCSDTFKSAHIYNTIITFNRRGRRQVFRIEKLHISYCTVPSKLFYYPT